MRRRLYFLSPDLSHARQMFNHLLLARIETRHIHVLAKEGMDLGDLPEANVSQKSDIVHGAEQGIISGGLTGLLLGLVVFHFPPEGMSFSYGIILMMFLLGAGFGIWVSSLIGSGLPNSKLRAFRCDIDKGKILMMVDVPVEDMEKVTVLMKEQHPEAAPRGIDPTMPAFP